MNESENKQLATNASIDRERMRYVNALFNGTSNTKRQRLYQEFGYPKELCFDDFYRAYRRNAIASRRSDENGRWMLGRLPGSLRRRPD
ncbi:hypothetical protein NX009_25615 [Klebsiella pneumoniae]|nr:hypothetical protein [Klebsiella pneumoniae]